MSDPTITVLAVEDEPVLSADEARAIVNRVRQCVAVANAEIKRLYQGRAWIPLGYGSWEAMCLAEFGDRQVRLSRPERQEAVAELSDAGMSTRAIGAAVGAGQATVLRDLHAGEPNGSPADDEVIDAEIVEEPPPVTGRDGKHYPRTRAPIGTTRARVAELAAGGSTVDQIADELNLRTNSVYRILRDSGTVTQGPSRLRAAVERDVQRMRDLAADNCGSRQIAKTLGISANQVASWRKRYNIDVPADAFAARKRRLDSDRIVEGTVAAVSGVDALFHEIDYPSLDRDQLADWVSSLDVAIKSLTTLRNNLKKELTQ